jgi:hypothetical protein
MRVIMSIGLLWLAAVTAAPAQRLKPPLGSHVSVSLPHERSLAGELLAVDQDSIWLLQPQRMASVPLRDVSQVRVDRGGMGPGTAAAWSLMAGLISGFALQSACASVSDGCGSVLPATLGVWAFVGGLSALSLESTRYKTLAPESDSLRAHARFPQGLPAGMTRDSLVP